jgi:hypothetical protein
LSQLDSNFNTVITLGNTAIQLGNTVTTLNNMTLANVTISSGNVTITNVTITTANVTTANIGTAFVSGNVSFTGTSNRITGDFSNATFSSRVAFQTSTVNGSTIVSFLPNGTGTASAVDVYNVADPTNASKGQLVATATEVSIRSSINTGVATYLPMTFYTGGSEAVRIGSGASSATDKGTVGIGYTTLTGVGNNGLAVLGNVGIGTSSPGTKLDVVVATNNGLRVSDGSVTGVVYAASGPAMVVGTTSNHPTVLYSNNTERARIDASGNVLVTSAAGLGYGTGSGGTVTQATSKSTAVTLNKPTGQITMNNAALGAGSSVSFTLSNSLIANTDNLLLTFTWGFGPSYSARTASVVAGSAFITVKNESAGSLSEALVINFAIIKGATS